MFTLILSLIGLYVVYNNVYFKKGHEFISVKSLVNSLIEKAKTFFNKA